MRRTLVRRDLLTTEQKPLVTGRLVDPKSGVNYYIIEIEDTNNLNLGFNAATNEIIQAVALDGWTEHGS